MVIINMILPIVYIVVGCALVWFVVELALTIRKTRGTVTELKEQIDPTISEVQAIVKDVQPIIKDVHPVVQKVDPLMDRVTLTVDSVNLEMMRVDEILDNVTQITGGVTKAVGAVDNVTSAPLDLVNSLTNKFRTKFKPKYASDESVEIHDASTSDSAPNPFVDFVDVAADAASEALKDTKAKREEKKTAAQEKHYEIIAKSDKMDAASDQLTDQVLSNATADTDK